MRLNQFLVIMPSDCIGGPSVCSIEEATERQDANTGSLIVEIVTPADQRRIKVSGDAPFPLRVFDESQDS